MKPAKLNHLEQIPGVGKKIAADMRNIGLLIYCSRFPSLDEKHDDEGHFVARLFDGNNSNEVEANE